MSLAPYVRILARGQGRARPFTLDEAREAMALMLREDADPEALGAILMLLRLRGETAEDIAGFTSAARASLPEWQGMRPALDWPSYAAGRTRGLPWFLLSAKLVAGGGVPVLLHGWNSHQQGRASVRDALAPLGIPSAATMAEAGALLQSHGIAYLPLEVLSPRLMHLLRLRDKFGLRSCVNTVLRMLNPGAAPAAVQGVFHPSYRELQADAGRLLGDARLSVLKGGGGEFEHHPAKDIAVYGLRDGESWTGFTGRSIAEHRRLAEDELEPQALSALWAGELDDAFARATVLGTAGLALEAAGVTKEGALMAEDLWSRRRAITSV